MADEKTDPTKPVETAVKPYDPANIADLLPKYAPAEAHLAASATEQPAEATDEAQVASDNGALTNVPLSGAEAAGA